MRRQRIKVRRSAVVELIIRLLVTVLALATGFYGAMVALAALKLDPHTIDQISAYRTIQTRLSEITASNITGADRLIVAIAGILGALVFAPLAWRALPRPYRARTEIDLGGPADGPGHTQLAPRTVEQVADRWAAGHPAVTRALTRYGSSQLYVDVQMTTGEALLDTLGAVQQRVRDGLREYGLPPLTINVTLTAIHQGDTTP